MVQDLLSLITFVQCFNGELKVELEDQDEVRVFSLDEVEGDDDVLLSGFSIDSVINIPWRANLNLYDVVFSNTPYNENEFQADFLRSRVDVKRFNDNGLYSIIPLDIDDNRNFILHQKMRLSCIQKILLKIYLLLFKFLVLLIIVELIDLDSS